MPTPHSFLSSLFNWLSRWFGRRGDSPLLGARAVTMTVNNITEPPQALSSRVLVVVFDPIWDRATGRRLLQAPQTAQWSRVDDLLAGYIADVEDVAAAVPIELPLQPAARVVHPPACARLMGLVAQADQGPEAVRPSPPARRRFRTVLAVPGVPLRASRSGADVGITWDTAQCPAAAINVYYGALGDFSTFTGGRCNLPPTGSATVPLPGNVWFLAAATDTVATDGSYGRTLAGAERNYGGASLACPGITQHVTNNGCP